MSDTTIIKPLIDAMKPKGRGGMLPKVTQCPYCGINMSQAEHANHRPICAQDHRMAPPQPARLDQDAGGGYNADGTYPQT